MSNRLYVHSYDQFDLKIKDEFKEFDGFEWFKIYPYNKFKNNLSMQEILSAFPDECVEYLPGKIAQLENDLSDLTAEIKAIKSSAFPSWQKDFYINAIITLSRKKPIIEQLESLKLMLRLVQKPKSNKESMTDKIIKAKQMPILELYNFQKIRKLTNKTQACCPLHDDSSASFYIYHNTNSFNCFGCQTGGSSIDFYMKLFNCDFKTAVNKMV